jgi:ATP-dependent Lon protease
VPGISTGLAVTSVGGDILFVEAARMNGTGELTVTGQLGDVMKEKEIVAYHELGHAIVAMTLPETDPVQRISIVPRGIAALGYNHSSAD